MKFYTLIIIVFLFSCNRISPIETKVDHSINILFPSVIEKVKICKYSEIYDSIRVIKLETIPESLIGRIDKILVKNEHFFILDQAERKAVLEFDSKGKFVRRYGNVGKGPGKYNLPNDISIIGDKLAIWVSEASKFIIYGLDGEFIREVKTRSSAKSGTLLPDDSFALYMDIGGDTKTKEKFNLKILDNNGNMKSIGFEKKDKDFSKGTFFFSQNGDEVLTSTGYLNEVYSVQKDSTVKKFDINFGSHKMPENYSEKFPSSAKFDDALKKSEFITLLNYFDTPNHIVFSFSYHSSIYSCFFSKKTKKLKFGNIWFNNVHGILPGVNKAVDKENVFAVYDPSGIGFYKKHYTYPLSSAKVSGFIREINGYYFGNTTSINKSGIDPEDYKFSKKEFNDIINIKTTDNPVLMVQRLKDF